MKPYDYKNRKGIKEITWEGFKDLTKELTKTIPPEVDAIVGVARGGLYPATFISHLLQKELYPIRISRRINDIVTFEHPEWIIKPSELIKDKKVLIVDDICDTGETLKLIKEEVLTIGVQSVFTATLYSHTHGRSKVDFASLETDELIINPWDKEIFTGQEFIFNPEYKAAIESLSVPPSIGNKL